uniref:G-protein coupled receptors family 1 profile domain-containing protein n=1 Tax=Ascaris lumbricoides TaxID=6252 RepID=A0A9J2PEI5_ASCLU
MLLLSASNHFFPKIAIFIIFSFTMPSEHLEHERKLRFIIYIVDGYLMLFCVFIGVLFNAFSIIIFRRRNRGKFSLAQYYLVILLICQTALLCQCLLLYCLPTLIYGDTQISGLYTYVILIAHAFSGPSYIAITWIVLALAIERYFALRKPFAYRAMATAGRVKGIIAGLLVVTFIFCIPRLFEYKSITQCKNITSEVNSSTSCYLTVASTEILQINDSSLDNSGIGRWRGDVLKQLSGNFDGENETYWNVYHVWLIVVFATLLPSLVILFLTVRISCFLHNALKERRWLDATERNERSRNNVLKGERESNIMLIIVIIKFALSDPLPMVESVLGAEAPEDSPASAALQVSVANFLVALCCSINFFTFFAFGQRFRHECRKIIFGKRNIVASSRRNSTDETWLSQKVDVTIVSDSPPTKHSNTDIVTTSTAAETGFEETRANGQTN